MFNRLHDDGRFRRGLGGLMLTLMILLPTLPAQAAKYALLIGINQYKEQGTPSLSGPVNDVRALREVLVRRWGFPENHIVSLVDQQATGEGIRAELQRLETRTRPGDTVLLYYSGHGTSYSSVRVDATTKSKSIPEHSGAWIPYDLPRNTGTPQAQVANLIIGHRDLRPVLERLDRGGRQVYLISDSCYSGEVFRGQSCEAGAGKFEPLPSKAQALPSDQFEKFPTKADLTYPYQNVVFLSASGPGETAWDLKLECLRNYPTLDGMPHGALTDALLRALDGKLPGVDRNSDGQISHDELFRAVRGFMDQRDYPHTPQEHPNVDDWNDRLVVQLLPLPIFGEGQAPPSPPVQTAVSLHVEVPGTLAALRKPLSQLPDLSLAGPPFDLKLQAEEQQIRLLSVAGEEITRLPAQNLPALADTLRHQAWLKRLWAKAPVQKGRRVTIDLAGRQGGSLCLGESYALAVWTEQPAYLVVLDLFPQGQTSVYYPYTEAELKRHPAGSVTRFPDDGTKLTVTCPCGEDILVALAFPEEPKAIRQLMGAKAQAIEPGGALRPVLRDLWQEAEQRAAWGFLRIVTTGQCPQVASAPKP